MPAVLYIPLQQHIGAPAEVLVAEGDLVKKGQMIARNQGAVSASQHAPTSGRIKSVTDVTAPHPSGLPQTTIILESDGKDEWVELPEPIADPLPPTRIAINDRVAQSGIVGMGGAAFPSAIKLNLGEQKKLDTLLLNGAECEPYLTCDDRVMREYRRRDHRRRPHHGPRTGRAQDRHRHRTEQAAGDRDHDQGGLRFPKIEVAAVPVQYPMGSERHLVQAITGRETPARKLTADLGIVVHNVSTARAVHHAVRFGRPLISRVVTVSGGAIRNPSNVMTPIGARVADLVEFCGGFAARPESVVNGGPDDGAAAAQPGCAGGQGHLRASWRSPPRRSTTAPPAPASAAATASPSAHAACRRSNMAAFIRKDNLEGAAKLGVMDCFSCGSCSWVCPSHIPLVHYFNYAKGAINELERERRKNERIKILAEVRTIRLEKAAEAKRAALAARKSASENAPSANAAETKTATEEKANA